MLPCLQSRYCVRRMIRNRSIDVNRINVRISQQSTVIIVALFHAILVTNFIQSGLRPLTNGRHIGIRMTLINRDEFGTKTESDNRNINLLV